MIYGVSGMGFAEGTGEALKPISNQDVSSCESQSDIVSTAEKFDMGQENGGGVSCTMCFFFSDIERQVQVIRPVLGGVQSL